MNTLISAAIILAMSNPLPTIVLPLSDRTYQPIADVDKRAIREEDYRFYILEYDTQADIIAACNSSGISFTGRGCVFGYRIPGGRLVFRVMVLSNDHLALKHELDHMVFGPCHTDSVGPTPLPCQEWLIKHKLEPIGSQVITIKDS